MQAGGGGARGLRHGVVLLPGVPAAALARGARAGSLRGGRQQRGGMIAAVRRQWDNVACKPVWHA